MKPAFSRNPSLLIVLLTGLLAVALVSLRNAGRSSASHSSAQPADELETPPVQPEDGSRPISDEVAQRLSPRSWTPPAVFSEVGRPAARIQHQRGKDGQRLYGDPTVATVQPGIADRDATILAKTPEDGRLYLLPGEIDVHTSIARRMVFDPASLDSVIASRSSRILAPTVGDEVLTLEIESVKTRSADSHTLKGRILGEVETSDVQLVYHDGVIHGTVARFKTDEHFEYRILADGHMMVRKLDTSTMVDGCGNGPHTETEPLQDGGVPGTAPAPEAPPEGDTAADTAGYRTIDVVVGYDKAARIADGGVSQIEARIIGSIDRMNSAFVNSAITDAEVVLLGTMEDPDYVFPGSTAGSMSDELSELYYSADGSLDAIHKFGRELGTDFLSFITKDVDGSAGVAYRPGSTSITARTYMTTARITFAHELGHNLGCDHSWGDSSQAYKSEFGWRFDPVGHAGVRTIMAYDWDWGSGARIPYFANPDVSYQGEATGAPLGFDVANQPNADQRYRKGGLNGPDLNKSGFDGTNPNLGANNAGRIRASNGATMASLYGTRTAPSVVSPANADDWLAGSTREIYFIGGDGEDSATVELLSGGSLHSTLTAGVNPATGRRYSWAIPFTVAAGTDYTVRVTVNHPEGNSTVMESANFTIREAASYSITYDANGATSGSAPASQEKYEGQEIALAGNTGGLAKNGYSFAGWCTTADGSGNRYAAGSPYSDNGDVILYARWNTPPVVDAGPGDSVRLVTVPRTPGWEYGPWTDDSSMGLLAGTPYTVAHSFGNTNSSGLTVGGVSFTESLATSGSGWNVGGAISNTTDTTVNITGGGLSLARQFIYNGKPRTVTFSGLTAGETYEAVFYSVAWETGDRTQTFSSPSSGGSSINQSVYGNNNGIRIACVYTPSGTSETFTITPGAGGTFHLYAMTNRAARTTSATATLAGAAIDADSSDILTTTWTKLSGPGPVSFADSSDSGTNAFFTVAGTYVLRLTASDGIAQSSDDVTINVTDTSPYDAWGDGSFTHPFTDRDPSSDPDGDGMTNFIEYAFGMDPTSSAISALTYETGGEVTVSGVPLLGNFASTGAPADYRAVFIRRKDHAAAGLSYTPLFSADLGLWTPSTAGLSILTDTDGPGELEAVSVPFPGNVPLQGGGEATPAFFRIEVTGE